jgi:hypothetical protein
LLITAAGFAETMSTPGAIKSGTIGSSLAIKDFDSIENPRLVVSVKSPTDNASA